MGLTVIANNKNMKFKCTEYKNGEHMNGKDI